MRARVKNPRNTDPAVRCMRLQELSHACTNTDTIKEKKIIIHYEWPLFGVYIYVYQHNMVYFCGIFLNYL